MASIDLITKTNFVPTKLPTKVPAEKVNEIIQRLNSISDEDGEITVSVPTKQSVDPAITATAGGTKAAAYQLTEQINVVTTCATALDSVLLPAADIGLSIVIANLGVATCAVYGKGTNTIDDIATANPLILQPESVVTLHCYTTEKWQTNMEAEGVYDKVYTDTIAENTSAAGVTIDSVTLKDGGATLTAQIAVSGGATQQALLTTTVAQRAITINSTLQTVDAIVGSVTVNSSNYNFISCGITPSTALSGGEVITGTNFSLTSLSTDADASQFIGYKVNLISTAGTGSYSDMIGLNIVHSGSVTTTVTGRDITGVNIKPTATINSGVTTYYGINLDVTGMTNTSSAASYGVYVNSNSVTTPLGYGGYFTDGTRIVGLTTSTHALTITGANLFTGTGVTTDHLFDVAGLALTTGSIWNFSALTTKTSGYLYNGSMTTSTLDASTLLDDYSVSCAHDGLAADTLRMIRRGWSGACPNGTAAADLTLVEYDWSGTYGNGGALGGDVNLMQLVGTGTVNDSGADLFGLNVSLAGVTLTSAANVYGILVTGKTGVDAGINVAGASTSGISVSGAATQQLLLTSTTAQKALTVTSTGQTVTPVTITSDSAISSAAYITATTISQTNTSASAINMTEVLQVTLTSAVELGNWANAICAKVNLSTAGYAAGIIGVVCAELDFPSNGVTGGSGQYHCFEAEMNLAGTTGGVPKSFLNMNVWGAEKHEFDDDGYIFDIQGIADHASGKVFQANNNAADHALRIRINNEAFYMLLSAVSD